MNELLSIYFTWQFLLLCMGIAAITFVIRTIVEYFVLNNPNLPGNSQSKFWKDLGLVVLPILLGFLFPTFAKSFTYPAALDDVYSKHLFAGSAGLLSPTLYRVIKAFLWKNVSENAPQVTQDFPSIKNLTAPDRQKNADDANPEEPKL